MWLSRPRSKTGFRPGTAVALLALILESGAFAQTAPVRRAQPVNEPPVARALPVDQTPAPRVAPTPGVESTAPASSVPPSAGSEAEPPDRRQLEYATALFRRKLYDLAAPEFEKYLDQYPNASGEAQAQFFLGESYRALNRAAPARRAFQNVLDQHPDTEYAGAAAYVLAETAFTEKNYGAALPLFHRAATKAKEPAVFIYARNF